MNNFKGVLEEYSTVAIDYFEGESLNCNAYFLSHCHTDHMTGLGEDAFFNRLRESSEVKLYCSQITKDLLSNNSFDYRYSRLSSKLVSLPINEPTTITVQKLHQDEYETVVVTLLPAGHCPGSVMFLFEGDFGTVIYTGDFRLTVGQLRIMEHLHYDGISVKKIDNLYVDTTFCFPEALEFPSRTESRNTLFGFLDPWLNGSDDTVVYVNGNSQFGYEHVFVELAKRYKMKVHVCNGKLWKYKNIPEIMNSITKNAEETRIHACFYKDGKRVFNGKNGVLPCERNLPYHRQRELRYVNLSTMWFNHYASSNLTSHECSENWIRILYSMHSSYREILELVRYLNPRSLRPLVIPNDTTLELLLHRLKSCRNIDELKKSFQTNVSSLESETRYFGTLDDVLAKSQSLSFESQLVLEEKLSLTPEKRSDCVKSVESSEIEDEDRTCSPKWTFFISPVKNNNTVERSFVKEQRETSRHSNTSKNRCDSVESTSDSNGIGSICEDVEITNSFEDIESDNQGNSVEDDIANNRQNMKTESESSSIENKSSSKESLESGGDADISDSQETTETEKVASSIEDNCSSKGTLESTGDVAVKNSSHCANINTNCSSLGNKCISDGTLESSEAAEITDSQRRSQTENENVSDDDKCDAGRIAGTGTSNLQRDTETDLEDSSVEDDSSSSSEKTETINEKDSKMPQNNFLNSNPFAFTPGDATYKVFEKYLSHFVDDDNDKVSKASRNLLSRNENLTSETYARNKQTLEVVCDSDETECYSTEDEIEYVTTVKSRKSKLCVKSSVPNKIPKLVDLTKDSSQENNSE